MIPPATHYARQVTPSIITSELRYKGGYKIKAEYHVVLQYTDPNDAPVYAIMAQPHLERATWAGDITLQGFGFNEVEALTALLEALRSAHAPISEEEWAAAANVARLLAATLIGRDPWEQLPLPRPPKPRAKRKLWRDAQGKRIRIYDDERGVRHHKDPNCDCAVCLLLKGKKPCPT